MPDGAKRGLVAACLTASLMPLNSTMIAVAVPDIAHDVGHPAATVTQALVATYLVAAIALQSPGGKLGDRLGHWRVFKIGQAALAAGALLGFVAPNLVLLAVSRVVMAVGGAVVVPATLALIRTELPTERTGRAFGAFGAVMSLAAGIGPIVGGELVDAFGWPSVFLANLPVLGASVLFAMGTRRPARTATRPAAFDWPGSVLLTAALVAVVVGAQLHGTLAPVVATVGGAIFVPFVLWERRASDPVIAFGLFRSRIYTAGTLLIALLNLVMYALVFEIPLTLHALFRLDSEQVGRLLIFLMAAMVLTSLIAGRLTDRLGPRLLAVVGTAAALGALALMRFVDLTSADRLRVPLVLLGVGLGLANPAAQNASLSGVDRAVSGMAAGVSSTMRYLGGIAGVAVLGRLVHSHSTPHEVLAQHHDVLTVFIGVLAVALVCAALLRRPGAAGQAAAPPLTQVFQGTLQSPP